MVYNLEEIKMKVKMVADNFDIEEILLFGSYYSHTPTDTSDIDLIVRYGDACRGLIRMRFINELEATLQKEVDVINAKFLPSFMTPGELYQKGSTIYEKH